MTIELCQKEKLFNLAEAREHLDLVQKITKSHQISLSPIQVRLNKMLSNDPRRVLIEKEYQNIVSKWRTKIQQLGASVARLWMVEFNVGDAVLCWRYPELSINYVREKDQDFDQRRMLDEYVASRDPDWA